MLQLPVSFFSKTFNTFVFYRLSFFYRIFSFFFDFKDRNLIKSWAEGGIGAYRDPLHFSKIDLEFKKTQDIFLKYVENTDIILDLGCNTGRAMSYFNDHNIKNLHGVDIMKNALNMTPQLFPELAKNNNCRFFHNTFSDFYKLTPDAFYDCTMSWGATIELVHPKEKIIQNICRTTKKYVFLVINEHSHYYPKFYIYEFYRNSFDLIYLDRLAFEKHVDGKSIMTTLIFKKRI